MTAKGKNRAIGLGALALVTAFTLATVQYSRQRQKTELAETLAKAKAAGLGVDASYFATTIPDSENLWTIVHKISLKSKLPLVTLDDLTSPDPAEVTKAKRDLAASRPLIQPIQDKDRLEWQSKYDLRDPLIYDQPEPLVLYRGVSIFVANAYVLAIKGQWDAANRDIQTAARIERPGDDWSVQSLNQSKILSALGLILVKSNGDSRAQKLVHLILPLIKPLDSKAHIANNCAWVMNAINVVESGKISLDDFYQGIMDGSPPYLVPPDYAALRKRVLNYYIRVMETVPALGDDYVAIRSAVDRIPPVHYEEWQSEHVFLDTIGSDFSLPALRNVILRAQSTLLQTAADIYAYKNAHGQFPKSLTDLPTTPPLDPFSKSPLLYRLQGKGFVLWSVGEDGSDDGGQVTKDRNPDLVFQTADQTLLPLLGR